MLLFYGSKMAGTSQKQPEREQQDYEFTMNHEVAVTCFYATQTVNYVIRSSLSLCFSE